VIHFFLCRVLAVRSAFVYRDRSGASPADGAVGCGVLRTGEES
jgi:hypothetical protein